MADNFGLRIGVEGEKDLRATGRALLADFNRSRTSNSILNVKNWWDEGPVPSPHPVPPEPVTQSLM